MDTTLMSATDWAQTEFGGAELGDQRRTQRLIRVAAGLAEEAHGALPESFGRWAELKGAYRLMEQANVRYEDILAPHRKRVLEACRLEGDYLLVEDTTELDFSSHLAALDLGRIGEDHGRGLFVHSTLALRVERWNDNQAPEVTVLGLMGQRWWARTAPKIGKGKERKQDRLRRKRESQRWAAVVGETGRPAPGARWTFVADRESDMYEVFELCEDHGWGFIVRANRPRALADQSGLVTDALAKSPVLGRFSLNLRSRPGQPARTAALEVRSCQVQLRGPVRPGRRPAPRTMNVVEAREMDPPDGQEAIHWVLLTSWSVVCLKDAITVVKAYTRRWLIEEYHKALKTGTGIEHSQLSTAARITVLLGILAVVAVRLLNMKLLATTRPEDPVSPEELSPDAFKILEAKFGRPKEGWTNRSTIRAVARLGGFIGRKSDGEPGWVVIWRGWRKLMLLTQGFDLAKGEECG
jgi:hypothetical protein